MFSTITTKHFTVHVYAMQFLEIEYPTLYLNVCLFSEPWNISLSPSTRYYLFMLYVELITKHAYTFHRNIDYSLWVHVPKHDCFLQSASGEDDRVALVPAGARDVEAGNSMSTLPPEWLVC